MVHQEMLQDNFFVIIFSFGISWITFNIEKERLERVRPHYRFLVIKEDSIGISRDFFSSFYS